MGRGLRIWNAKLTWAFGHARKRGCRLIATLGVVGLFGLLLVGQAGPAHANSYTTIKPPPPGEDSHLDIITLIYGEYGGTFEADGLDFNNAVAGITVKRVFDDNDGNISLHVLSGDETGIDQLWTDGTVTVTAEVKYAQYDQSFGWNQGGTTGDNYEELLTDDDLGFPGVTFEASGEFLWGSRPVNGGSPDQWWSMQSENYDFGRDHMVTYFVEGLPDVGDATVWLLFWEDWPCEGDVDFNDFVIQVSAVPEPGTFFLVGAALAGLGAYRRRRQSL